MAASRGGHLKCKIWHSIYIYTYIHLFLTEITSLVSCKQQLSLKRLEHQSTINEYTTNKFSEVVNKIFSALSKNVRTCFKLSNATLFFHKYFEFNVKYVYCFQSYEMFFNVLLLIMNERIVAVCESRLWLLWIPLYTLCCIIIIWKIE